MSAALAERPVGAHQTGPDCGRPVKTRRPFAAHVFALAAVLLIGFFFVDPTGLQQADEGAAVAQANQLVRGDGWAMDHPFPVVDPDGTAFPLDLAVRKAGTDQFVVFDKHPVYPVMLAAAMVPFGVAGAVAWSTVGTLAAAIGAALIARRLHPTIDRTVLWSVGIGSPLLFDGYQVIAHTLGAAGVAFAVLCAVARERPVLGRAAGLAVSLGFSVAMRNEALLLAAALGCALLVDAALGRRWSSVTLGAVAWGAGIGAALADRLVSNHLIGATEVTPFRTPVGGSGFIGERLDAAQISLFDAASTPVAAMAAYLAFALVIVAVVIVRRDRRRLPMVGSLALAVGGLYALRAVAAPDEVISGLLVAFPVVVLGIGVIRRSQLVDDSSRLLAITAGLFAAGVLATQYANAGGGGWGGRYLAIGLPVVAPLCWESMRRAAVDLDRALVRRIAAGFIVVHVALGAQMLVTMRLHHHYADAVSEFVAETVDTTPAGDGDSRPVLVTTSRSLARLNWDIADGGRWLTAQPEDLAAMSQRLHEAGVQAFTFASAEPLAESESFADHYVLDERPEAPTVDRPWQGRVGYGVYVVVLRTR